jgi:hypothetical protein
LSDHRVQGMNMTNYIIDLRRPPHGKFTLENIYVMLSRATMWTDFAILCPFDDDLFLKNKPNHELQEYHRYLLNQYNKTKVILREEQSFIDDG